MPWNDAGQHDLNTSVSINNEDNLSQKCLLASLIKTVLELTAFQMSLGCVELTVNDIWDNLYFRVVVILLNKFQAKVKLKGIKF